MKTFDEINEAMRIVANEAYKSGFTFCGAIVSDDDPVTTIFCGESLKIIALTEVIKANVFEKNHFTDIAK
jgi:hypothetical protein